ncbi:MAG: adenylate/guanylate cyclase domain-containing protein, partial [Candidatus Peregrinibacteria bacterium]
SIAIARMAGEDVQIPTSTERDGNYESNLMYVNYFSEPNGYRQISLADVLEGKRTDKRGNPVDFKDKIILIGPTAIDLQDHYLAPTSAGIKMAGVEIHANAIQTILERDFLRDQSSAALWITILILIAANLALFSWLRVRYALPLAVVEMVGMLVAGLVAYEFGVFLNVVYPMMAVLLSFVGSFLLRFILEQKQRRFIQGAFGHYVNKSVVDQVLRHPELLELGGAKRTVTSFFSDIANFTGVSEKMEPQELVKFLNEYLQEMTEIVLAHQGTLDKYEGDAIVAFFGAPIAMHDHAHAACLTALEHQAKLRELRKKWHGEGRAELHVRIGLNTGEAVVGNMGSRDRFDYTAMGDNINLASRLEGVNKQYGTEILISESTYDAIKDELVCREVDLIRVKGKEKPVRIYELVGEKGKAKQDFASFAAALKLYRDGKFGEAKQKFQALPDDPVARVFAERCEIFLKNPPPTNWDGVYTFNVK